MEVKDWLGEENQLGIDIFNGKYRYENETFEEWLDRVSNGNKQIRQLIKEKKFLFGGRILASRGLHNLGRKITLSNCYVITPPEDNIESIFDCAKKLARTYSYGGGCGIDISKLAPKGSKVNNAARETSGSISFMDLYDITTKLIGQNGRRGALMISLDCNHPDIEEFIDLKSDLNKVTKANISIKITDDFMKAVKNNDNWELKYNRPETNETISKLVKAKDLFRKLAIMNWDYAEPGMLNWDRICNWSLLSEDSNFKFAGVNPCAEEPLPAGGSCLLGSINLSEFVINPFTDKAEFNYDGYIEAVKQSVIALNEVLHEGLQLHPLQEQRDSVNDWRQIGLGNFGWHDTLIKLGIRYGSKDSLDLADDIAFEMIDNAILQSAKLTHKYGKYPKYNQNAILLSPFFKENTRPNTKEIVKLNGLANSQLLTIAPTGSTATMLGVSTALEPIYNISYTRKTESLHGKDEYYKVYTPIVEKYMKANSIEKEEDLPDFINTAMNLNYKERIEMQSVWQKYIDASISSTVNVPQSFTVEDTEDLYILAWEKGLKGVTLFRDGCKRLGILTNSDITEKTEVENKELLRGYILDVSDDLIGKKRKLITGCGSLHVLAYFDPTTGDLLETYLAKGSTGGCNNFMIGLSRMLSLSVRAGVDIHTVVDQLGSSGVCPSYTVRKATKGDTSKGNCCPTAIGNALLDMYKDVLDELGIEHEEQIKDDNKVEIVVSKKPKCPICKSELQFQGGCNSCSNCGYSKCD